MIEKALSSTPISRACCSSCRLPAFLLVNCLLRCPHFYERPDQAGRICLSTWHISSDFMVDDMLTSRIRVVISETPFWPLESAQPISLSTCALAGDERNKTINRNRQRNETYSPPFFFGHLRAPSARQISIRKLSEAFLNIGIGDDWLDGCQLNFCLLSARWSQNNSTQPRRKIGIFICVDDLGLDVFVRQ